MKFEVHSFKVVQFGHLFIFIKHKNTLYLKTSIISVNFFIKTSRLVQCEVQQVQYCVGNKIYFCAVKGTKALNESGHQINRR